MDQFPEKAEFMEELSKTKCSRRERRRIGLVYSFSRRHHRFSPVRATKEPYFWHIHRGGVRMAQDFHRFGVWDAKIVEIYLLHDTIEDASDSKFDPALVYRKVVKTFGNELAYGTLAMTKRKGEDSEAALVRLIHEQYWKVLIAKIYDRADNLRTLYGMDEDRQKKKLRETEKHFPAIFMRLKAELTLLVTGGKISSSWLLLLEHLRKEQLELINENRKRLLTGKI